MEQSKLFESLKNPSLYGSDVDSVDVLQTHISFVALTGKYAYKIKKPVNFGFLDFSTLEKRKYYCEEEIRLNRRLCPDIYLDVVPLTKKNNNIQLNGEGEIIEYAVKMREFPQEHIMTKLLKQGRIDEEIIDNICNNNLQGIMLNNADHCTVTNNKCYNNKMGIYLSTSSDNTMEYNNCSYSSWDGVALVKSTKNSLSRNVVKNNYYGVVIAESDNNQLTYNYISENTGIGIALMKTERNKINNNDIFDNTGNDLAGMICFDDANRNYWGRFRPRFLREVVFLGWVRIFPWALFRYT